MKTVLSRRLVRRSFTFGASSEAGNCVVLRYVLPSLVTEMVTASLLSAACMAMGFRVLTMSTLTPFDNMGVMTMKMMSNTSITSTMGVTLISAIAPGALPLLAIILSFMLPSTLAGGGPAAGS